MTYVLTGCGFSGPPQQYAGQEDYYGDQYSHGAQGPPEGMNQQYYPDGNLSECYPSRFLSLPSIM